MAPFTYHYLSYREGEKKEELCFYQNLSLHYEEDNDHDFVLTNEYRRYRLFIWSA